MQLTGKNAVVTGARRGIGRSILKTFVENGANVWACIRQPDEEFSVWADKLADQFSVFITPLCFDITDSVAMKAAVKRIMAEKLPVDILVNNAGIVAESRSFTMTSIETMKAVFETNFFAQMEFTQYMVRLMIRKQSGSIINIASIAGLDGAPGQLEYVASKAAVIGATKKLAIELGEANIRINAIAPGIIETDMGGKIGSELRNETLKNTIMHKAGSPEEIAGVALFLASDQSSYMTGQVIRVDGGM